MPSDFSIPIRVDDPFSHLVDVAKLVEMAEQVLRAEHIENAAELSIYITDDATVQRLNREYLDIDEPTDVLSFSLAETGEHGFLGSAEELASLGEVIIAYPTAERQAREQGHTVGAEIDHLLVHGILHILGYDHVQPDDEQRMRQREAELLGDDPHHT